MGRLDISVFKSIDFLGKGAFWSTRHPVPFHIGEIDFAHVHVYEPARVKEHVVEECEQLWFLYSTTMKLSPSPRIEYGVPLRTQKGSPLSKGDVPEVHLLRKSHFFALISELLICEGCICSAELGSLEGCIRSSELGSIEGCPITAELGSFKAHVRFELEPLEL